MQKKMFTTVVYVVVAALILFIILVYLYSAPSRSPTKHKLHYEVYGDRNAPIKILYVVGFATNWKWWKDNIIHLQPDDYETNKFCIAVLDNRGAGQSFTPMGIITPRTMALDAWEVILHELKWDSVHLIGQSMGGLITQQMVQLYNERDKSVFKADDVCDLRSVTLFNTFISFYHFPFGLPLLTTIRFVLKMPLKFTSSAVTKAVLQQMFSPNYFAAHYNEIEEKFKELFHGSQYSRFGSAKQLLGMLTHYNTPKNFVAQFSQLNRPVLIICSTADAMVAHRNSLEMHRLLTSTKPTFDVTLEVIEGAGHICMAEAASHVNSLLYKTWLLKHQ